jgi:hypothetical protein
MFNNLILYAANRATQGAVDNVARKAAWGGFAVVMSLAGLVFGLIVAFWLLSERYNVATAGLILAGVCFVVAMVGFAMPSILERRDAAVPTSPTDNAKQAMAAVKVEASEAVDYFGPIRVVASAFMLGLGAARQIKRR